jgi:hypothetical protein
MTTAQLKQKLIDMEISPVVYSLDGDFPNDAFVLSKNETNWSIYYAERGLKMNEIFFETENEACDYFIKKCLPLIKKSSDSVKYIRGY